MSLEGLQAILSKEEVVSTPLASDLQEQPERVNQRFLHHVRTYVPLGRQVKRGEQGPSVIEFERQVIREVRDGNALRGYITGEYGYGKTSTALYLWERANSENLLAIPPFKLQSLNDLVIASYGWARYKIEQTRPDLLPAAQKIYSTVLDRSAEAIAQRYNMSLDRAQQLIQEKPEVLRLTTQDYIRFIEDLTSLAHQADFSGVLVLADELQQYIEPSVQAGQREPISALFDLIEAIRSRRGNLAFGFLLIIPPKDLGLLRDQRGDLVHRILQNSLDLGSIYDRWFPERLWQRLAQTFDFEQYHDQVISPECLDALGQIAARNDLSDGPRTVINAFRRAAQRAIAATQPEPSPYTPELLIEDFLNGQIQFDSARRIPHITSQALGHSMVKGHPARERAIKWAAAFPQEGLPRALQERLGLADVLDDLARSVLNDLLIEVGDRRDGGVTLRGLDQVGVQTDWLTSTIREFWRSFEPHGDNARQQAITAFLNLLTAKIFPSNHWKVLDRSAGGLFPSAGLTLEGSFSSGKTRFPDRRIVVRVLWQDEPDLGSISAEDITILFRLGQGTPLTTHNDDAILQIDQSTRQVRIWLDVTRRIDKLKSPQLEQHISPVVLSSRLNPLLLLTLHQFLDDKRVKNLIPKEDLQFIQFGFQSALQDSLVQMLFHPDLAPMLGANQERVVERALTQLLEQLFPDYKTLLSSAQWQSSLQKYINALQKCSSSHERQGKLLIEGTKQEIADLFLLSITAFENFVSNFSTIITIEHQFPTRQTAKIGMKGAIRFRLHPLEQNIQQWLSDSSFDESVNATNPSLQVRRISIDEVYRKAIEQGYLHQEVEEILNILVERQLVERDQRRGILREVIPAAPSTDELERELRTWQAHLNTLAQGFPQSGQLRQWQDDATTLHRTLEELHIRPTDEQALVLKQTMVDRQNQLLLFAEEQQQHLKQQAAQALKNLPRFTPNQISTLDTTVHGSYPFTQALNGIRSEALKTYETIDDQLKTLRQKLEGTQRQLQNERLPLGTLAQTAQLLTSYEKEAEAHQQQYISFIASFSHFTNWRTIAEQAPPVAELLQTQSQASNEIRQRFEQLIQTANTTIHRQTYANLPNPEPIKKDLQSIQEEIQRIRAEASEHFHTLQERYRQLLHSTLRARSDELWTPHSYNPQAVTEMNQRLLDDVTRVIQSFCDRLGRTLRQMSTDVRSNLQSPLLQAVPPEQRQQLREQSQDIEQNLTAYGRELMLYEGQIEDQDILRDLPVQEKGQFRRLLQGLAGLETKVEQLQQRTRELQGILQSFQLTPLEDQLLTALTQITTPIELYELRSMVDTMIDTEFWQALQGLYAKRRLRLQAERVDTTF